MRLVRVVSNGYGEDLIAARIISALNQGGNEFEAFPLVGNGPSYFDLGLIPKVTQTVLPSGGFLLRFRDLFLDIKAGLFMQCQKQYRLLRGSPADFQLVVGDVYALFMATHRQDIPTIFFPTAKSERAIPHYAMEVAYIRKNAQVVFPRDKETHERFIQKKIPSKYFGNPMFDAMCSSVPKGDPTTIAILPGSRREAVQNMVKILRVISKLELRFNAQFVISLPHHFGCPDLKAVVENQPWRLEEMNGAYSFKSVQSSLRLGISYEFFDVLQASSIVIGLAGTANEQAMHAGRPLISFIGCGPQSTKQRFKQQHKLIDGADTKFIDSNDPDVVAKEISNYLNQKDWRWTPLSDHYQMASRSIADYLHQTWLQ